MQRGLVVLAVVLTAMFAVASLAFGEGGGRVIRLAYDDEAQTSALEQLASAYMDSHAGLEVELVRIPTASYYTRLESMAMGSVLPDVFVLHTARAMDFVSAGALMDLSPAQIDFSPFPEAVSALYRYNDIPYAVPKDVDGVALAYNKALFAAAEIELPSVSWTWQDLRDAALNLTDPELGIWGFGAPNEGPDGYYNLILQNGGFVYRDGESGFNLPETQEAVQFWTNLALVDRVSPMPEHYPDLAPSEWLITGEVAMQFVSASQIPKLDAASTLRDNFDIVILPMQKQRAAVCDGTAFAAAANTPNADIVLPLMGFLATHQAAELIADATVALPAHEAARADYGLAFQSLTLRTFSDMLEYAQPLPISPMRSVWAPLEVQALETVYERRANVSEALDALHEQITALEAQ